MVNAIPIGNLAECYANALAIEREAAARSAQFAEFLDDHGEQDAAELFHKLARYEQQAGIGLAVRKHILAERGVIASAAIRKPGPKLSAADIADIARLTARQQRRLAEIGDGQSPH